MDISPAVGGNFKITVSQGAAAPTAGDLVRGARLATHAQKSKSRTSAEVAPRFVILKPAVALLYYETDADPADRPKGLMLLDDASAVDVARCDGGAAGGGHVVVVRPAPGDPDARALFFHVASAAEAREWQVAFQACRVSAAAAERGEAERRLLVSRAETDALHASLSLYKALAGEREDDLGAVGARLEGQLEQGLIQSGEFWTMLQRFDALKCVVDVQRLLRHHHQPVVLLVVAAPPCSMWGAGADTRSARLRVGCRGCTRCTHAH